MALHKLLLMTQASILKMAVITIAITIAFTTKSYSQNPASQNNVMKYIVDTTYVTGKSTSNPIYHTAEDATIKALCDYVLFTHLYDSTNFGAEGISSVGLSMPSLFSVTPTPITSSGTFSVTFTGGQTANQFLATPNGSSGSAGLRTIVAADIPTLNQNTTGTASNITSVLNASSFPALTGDVVTTAGSTATTLVTVNSSPGSVGTASAVSTFTDNGKGLVTTQSSVPIAITASQVSGIGATAYTFTPTETFSVVAMNNALEWNTGIGAIAQIVPPTDQSFKMQAPVPVLSGTVNTTAAGNNTYMYAQSANAVGTQTVAHGTGVRTGRSTTADPHD